MGGNLLQEMMREYFDNAEPSVEHFIQQSCEIPVINTYGLPVATQQTSWEVVDSPRRLMKTYAFENASLKKAFVIELLEYEEEINHHAKTTINADTVIVEVYTHDVDDVTELDQEYAASADDIYEDIKHYEMRIVQELM